MSFDWAHSPSSDFGFAAGALRDPSMMLPVGNSLPVTVDSGCDRPENY